VAELLWDARVDEKKVHVDVDRGVVTLTGVVDSYPKRIAAQEAAHAVAGVLDVANDIRVEIRGSHTRTDTEIAEAVREALRWSVVSPADHVQTTVSDGFVTLSGEVDGQWQRTAAERAIEHLAGVRGVINRIAIKIRPVQPAELKLRIEEALERRAELEARSLGVEVNPDGVVTLTGRVDNWAEAQVVRAVVGFAPGVRSVVDHLELGRTV
jgi:osmotically-inducible protein OsmY